MSTRKMLFIASAVTGCASLPFYGSQVEDEKSAREHAFVLMIRIMCICIPPPQSRYFWSKPVLCSCSFLYTLFVDSK